jgi:hypothetical protein
MSPPVVDLSRTKRTGLLVTMVIEVVIGFCAGRAVLEDCPPPTRELLFTAIVWLFAAALARGVHALLIVPLFVLSPTSIRLRYWTSTAYPLLGMLRPWHAVVDVEIPWADYLGCQKTRDSNESSGPWTDLYIATHNEILEIGRGVFTHSSSELMTALTDYQERVCGLPGRSGLGVADFNRQRFRKPVGVRRKDERISCFDVGCIIILSPLLAALIFLGGALAGLLLTLVGGVAVRLLTSRELADKVVEWSMAPVDLKPWWPEAKFPTGPALGGCVMLVLVPVGMLWRILADRDAHTRVLELRESGLALGKTPETLRVIPWEHILYAHWLEEVTRSRYGTFIRPKLEIGLHDRPAIVLAGNYDRRLEDLGELIDPPTAKLVVARQRMAEGEDAETAAVHAGLPRGL